MQHHVELLGVFDIAGISCAIESREAAFQDLLSSRYSAFASDAVPQCSLTVEVTRPSPDEGRAAASGPFARTAGRDGVLTIEGAGFRGAFDERTGRGWIAQPLDLSPLDTFLTAICAGRLLGQGGFFLHAAGIVEEGRAWVFFGPSGSGKTTVAELIGEGVISDEVVAIRPEGQGYVVSGVPWRGHRLSAPLGSLFFLRKGGETGFTLLSPAVAVRRLLPSVFFPRPDSPQVDRFFENAEALARTVPCYEMRFAADRAFWGALPRGGGGGTHGVSL
jgi:hypothetical protein